MKTKRPRIKPGTPIKIVSCKGVEIMKYVKYVKKEQNDQCLS